MVSGELAAPFSGSSAANKAGMSADSRRDLLAPLSSTNPNSSAVGPLAPSCTSPSAEATLNGDTTVLLPAWAVSDSKETPRSPSEVASADHLGTGRTTGWAAEAEGLSSTTSFAVGVAADATGPMQVPSKQTHVAIRRCRAGPPLVRGLCACDFWLCISILLQAENVAGAELASVGAGAGENDVARHGRVNVGVSDGPLVLHESIKLLLCL